jgi:hypothetical protein
LKLLMRKLTSDALTHGGAGPVTVSLEHTPGGCSTLLMPR